MGTSDCITLGFLVVTDIRLEGGWGQWLLEEMPCKSRARGKGLC